MSETPIGALLEVYTTLRATVRPAWAGVSTGGPGQDWDLEIQRESDLESWAQRQAGDYLGSFVEMGFIYVDIQKFRQRRATTVCGCKYSQYSLFKDYGPASGQCYSHYLRDLDANA